MFNPAIREVLKSPLIARLSVVDPEGYPHTVPLWFDLDGDDVVIISHRKTRKVDCIRANPKASICIGGGEIQPGKISPGYLLKGLCSLEEDPDDRWLRQITLRYEEKQEAEASIAQWQRELDIMIIRLTVEKVIKVYG